MDRFSHNTIPFYMPSNINKLEVFHFKARFQGQFGFFSFKDSLEVFQDRMKAFHFKNILEVFHFKDRLKVFFFLFQRQNGRSTIQDRTKFFISRDFRLL